MFQRWKNNHYIIERGNKNLSYFWVKWMDEAFSEEEWDNIKDHNLDFILSKPQFSNLLEKLGNSVDEDGYIIDKKTNRRVESNDFAEVKIKRLGAILPGSKTFIRKNIASFSEYLSTHMK